MSHTYYIVCVGTRDAINLGKFVCFDEHGSSVAWHATGWRDLATGEWVRNERLWKVVEKFLIINRGEELFVVEETVLQDIDPEGAFFHRVETFEEIMSPDPEPALELGEDDKMNLLAEKLKDKIIRLQKRL